jgi:hypothetical protein
MPDTYRPVGLEIKTAVHRDTLESYVFINDGDNLIRMTPEQAMDCANTLIQAAAVALQDSLLVRFLKEEVKLDQEALNHTLGQFLLWRNEREKAHEEECERRLQEQRRIQEGN